MGFEPMHGLIRLYTFQAYLFSLLSNSPKARDEDVPPNVSMRSPDQSFLTCNGLYKRLSHDNVHYCIIKSSTCKFVFCTTRVHTLLSYQISTILFYLFLYSLCSLLPILRSIPTKIKNIPTKNRSSCTFVPVGGNFSSFRIVLCSSKGGSSSSSGTSLLTRLRSPTTCRVEFVLILALVTRGSALR